MSNQPDDDGHLDNVAKGVTYKDVAPIAARLALLDTTEDERADIIALAACFTFCDPRERESMLMEVTQSQLLYFTDARRLVEREAAKRIRAQEGGA